MSQIALNLLGTVRSAALAFVNRCISSGICKLDHAKMFADLELVLHQMCRETSHFSPKEPLFCSVISFYARSRMLDAAIGVYASIPSYGCLRMMVSFNSLLAALLRCCKFDVVVRMYEHVLNEGDVIPDVFTFNVLIHAFCANGRVDDAWCLFDKMRGRGVSLNVVMFGSFVYWLCEKLMIDEAFRLKEDMMKGFGVRPNVLIYTSLIKGLCKMNELDKALELKDEIMKIEGLKMDGVLYSTLISALFSAG